ncbi:MAG: ribonuclease D [Pseudoxanthomonas sp.]
MPLWIDDPGALRHHLQQPPSWVGLDTEFIRERTYWPQLALVQLAIGEQILLIDPLVPGMADALKELLVDPKVLKVMHSASEDLVTFKTACGVVPSPLFDTQVAAALAGLASGMGYQRLVDALTGIHVDKGETRSDWMRRPLSDSQLHYAAEDVAHLGVMYRDLDARLQALGRRAWLDADCNRLASAIDQDLPDRWPHLSMRSAQFLDPAAQRRLLRVLRWRDLQARRSDKPRTWILDNELAATLAKQPPADLPALQDWLEKQPKAPRKLAEAIWQALVTPTDDEEDVPLARAATDADKKRLKRMQDAVVAHSAALALPDGILASRRWLEQLQDTGHWPEALSGWRREQLEPVLAPLLA